MFNLSTSDFKLAKSVFLVKFGLSTPAGLFKSLLLHNYTNLIYLLICS